MSEKVNNAELAHQQALREIIQVFESQVPRQLAERSGASFVEQGSGGIFKLNYCGDEYEITFPSGEVVNKTTSREVPVKQQIILLTYLVKAVAVPERDEWKTFKELSAAPHHWNVFIPEAITALTDGFGNDLAAFEKASLQLGGQPIKLGDKGYRFQVLPRITIQVGVWEADEEFPAQVSILFNASAQMQADAATLFSLAITLVRKLLYLAGKRPAPQ